MTYEEVASMIKSMGYENAYYQFDHGTATPPPFICFYYPEIDDVYADDSNYQRITELTIEFYTKQKDFDGEAVIESVLAEHGLTYVKEEEYIEGEKLYEVIYEMEVLINAYTG